MGVKVGGRGVGEGLRVGFGEGEGVKVAVGIAVGVGGARFGKFAPQPTKPPKINKPAIQPQRCIIFAF